LFDINHPSFVLMDVLWSPNLYNKSMGSALRYFLKGETGSFPSRVFVLGFFQ